MDIKTVELQEGFTLAEVYKPEKTKSGIILPGQKSGRNSDLLVVKSDKIKEGSKLFLKITAMVFSPDSPEDPTKAKYFVIDNKDIICYDTNPTLQ